MTAKRALTINPSLMSEKIGEKRVFSLLEVTKSIQKVLAERYSSSFWVKAELNKLNHYQHSGHCYPDLVEKKNGRTTAQMRATLWKGDYESINRRFLEILKEPLKDGIKILMMARISFDPVYGLSLRILDIDPAFTLGDLEKEKQESINRLKQEHLFNRNKTLVLPVLPKRIAVISVESSKGYADFLRVMDDNPWGYRFFHHLFPSLLQGDKAAAAIIQQMERIRRVRHHFDAVAIIRGGGGDIGLTCYNSYELARTVALFPLPVLTGIGHATNETVTEMVAHANTITPTKLAELLIQHFHNFAYTVEESQKKIVTLSGHTLTHARQEFKSQAKLYRSHAKGMITAHRNLTKETTRNLIRQTQYMTSHIKNYVLRDIGNTIERTGRQKLQNNKEWLVSAGQILEKGSKLNLQNENTSLETLKNSVNHLHPDNVLKRGYSITRINGVAIKSKQDVRAGDVLETTLLSGKIISTVSNKHKKP